MKPVRLSENVVSISDFKAKASDWLQKLADTDDPVVITQHGQAAAVLLSARAYDELTDSLRFVTAVEAGLRDAGADRVADHDEVRVRLTERLRKP